MDLNSRYGFIGTFLYYNYELFDAEKYGEASIMKESKISKLYFDPIDTSWIDFDYQSY